MQDERQVIFAAISQAYSDELVQQVPQLKSLLFDYGQQMDTTHNVMQTAFQLDRKLMGYAVTHLKTTPAAVEQLHQQLKASTDQFLSLNAGGF